MGRGGRGANGRGGHGSSCLRRIVFFCSCVFCQVFRSGKSFRSGCRLPLGGARGQGARLEVRRLLGVGGVVPMAAGGMGPRAFAASCSFALVSFARASGGAGALDRAAGCPWGVPWGRGARVEVRRVWGVGGVVLMAAVGMGPHTFTASCSFALVSSAGALIIIIPVKSMHAWIFFHLSRTALSQRR